MDNSRLPVEMCERIIDSCDLPLSDPWRSWTPCYHTALVCSAWLPRSRFNMYRIVHTDQFKLLLRTLEENSHLAHLVVKLTVVVAGHIPFAQFARLLTSCIILHLYEMKCPTHPPRFADTCLYPFSLLGIVKLKLQVSKSTARGLLRFIRSLAHLEQLTLTGDESLTEMGPIPALGTRRSQDGKPAALSKLNKLKLRVRDLPV